MWRLHPQMEHNMPTVGTHKPPFKGGTVEYMRWYARMQRKNAKEQPNTPWPEFYARAKAEAATKPPNINMKGSTVKLFGGALTPEYRRWYYRLQCEAKATNVQDWAAFFAAAKAEAVRQQGGQAPTAPVWMQDASTRPPSSPFGGASTPAYKRWYKALRKRARSLCIGDARWKSYFMQHKWDEMERQGLLEPRIVHVKPTTTVEDTPLRFDFAVPASTHHHLVTDIDNERQNHHG